MSDAATNGVSYSVREFNTKWVLEMSVFACTVLFPLRRSASDSSISEQFKAVQPLDNAGPDVDQSSAEFDLADVRTCNTECS